ncbi:UbiD family decarboxylase [Chloroflexota bacterium]
MPFNDIREFIARLEAEGEVQRIEEEIDWNLEAGAILRQSNEQDLPAPFFQKVKGYPEGYKLIGGIMDNHKRVAIGMDLDPNTPAKELIEEYLRRKQQPIKPVLIDDGPCKENICIGDKVDLLKFPVPLVHDCDGGRYIGTLHLTISKDLDSDWVNWGMYRHMLHNKNTVGIQMSTPARHLWQMYTKSYEPRQKPMEVAIAIGVEPISTFCASTPMPPGVSEVDIAGGIRGEPVELIKCETVDLTVPATAEIIIEGEFRPSVMIDEGPFGEFTGYIGGGRRPMPVIHVNAVTHRNNPILTIACPGIPIEDSNGVSVTRGAEFLQVLRARGLPVSGVYVPPEGASFLVIVAVKPSFANVADEIAHVIWATAMGRATPYIIIVDDDVDPFNMTQVTHAVATRCHPYRGIVRLEHTAGTPMFPWLSPYERKYFLGAKAYFDCTWPVDWNPSDVPGKVSFDTAYPPHVQQKARVTWSKYGY